MSQADRASAMRTPCNIVTLPVPTDTYVTRFMLDEARREAAARLPPGWFLLSLIEEEVDEVRRDHVELERLNGPPVGRFQIWRAPRNRYVVSVSGEAIDPWAPTMELDPCGSMTDAVQMIADFIDRQLTAWGILLRPARSRSRHHLGAV